MAERNAYSRTWLERLADGAPYIGVLFLSMTGGAWADPFWLSMTVGGVGLTLIVIGVERASHYRGQRDRYRRSLVALVTKVEMDQTRDYFAHLVPADVLAEAFPKPTPASPRRASEGCGSNHREANNDR